MSREKLQCTGRSYHFHGSLDEVSLVYRWYITTWVVAIPIFTWPTFHHHSSIAIFWSPSQMRTMVLEYAHLHLYTPQNLPSFVGVHIPAPWFASGHWIPNFMNLLLYPAKKKTLKSPKKIPQRIPQKSGSIAPTWIQRCCDDGTLHLSSRARARLHRIKRWTAKTSKIPSHDTGW